MNKPLFKFIRAIQASPPPSPSILKKKTMAFVGFFFVAVILSASLTILNIPLSVRAESSITKPSVPEFTVKLIDSSYDIPTTYSIDPYTGKNVTHPGSHVESRTIDVKIKNQPFTPYSIQESPSSANWTINFYYNIRFKGHFSQDWTELYHPSDGYPTQDSGSEYTVFPFQGEYSPTEGMELTSSSISTKFPSGAQVEFQVEAMIGYVHRVIEGPGPWAPWRFTGETSGWSNTQTITIGTSAPITTPNTSPSPSTPQDTTAPPDQTGPQTLVLFGLDWVQLAMLALLGVIAVLLVVVVVFLRKRSVK